MWWCIKFHIILRVYKRGSQLNGYKYEQGYVEWGIYSLMMSPKPRIYSPESINTPYMQFKAYTGY